MMVETLAALEELASCPSILWQLRCRPEDSQPA